MKRRLFSILLILAVGILSANAQRYDFSAIGPSGDTLYYKINTDSSSVTVVSPSPNYWYYMQGYHHAYHIIIPSFATDSSDSTTYVVRAIGDSAFYYCVHLSSVVIGDSIRTIGNYAFSTTTWLSSVTLGNSVSWIGSYAFGGQVRTITIPESVTYLGDYAFNGYQLRTINYNAVDCTSAGSMNPNLFDGVTTPFGRYNIGITTINIGSSVKRIPSFIFAHCGYLASINIPDSVLYIGSYAFDRCGLISVTIGNSVTSIGYAAFIGCNSLTSVSMGNSVVSIGSSAFAGCGNLNSFVIPNSLTTIGESAFYSCGLDSIIIPNSVTSIGVSAFSCCNNLSYVELPNSITTIEQDVFYYCHKLRSIVIPDAVTSIGRGAFQGCDSLKYVTIGSSVSQIGSGAFGRSNNGLSRIERITVLCTVPPTLQAFSTSLQWGSTFDTASISGIPVYVPCGSVAAYSSANEWNRFTNLRELDDCTNHYWDFHKTTPSGSSVYYKILEDSSSVAVVHPLATDSIDGTFWHGYRRTSGALEIPDTVLHDSMVYVVRVIGSHAFEGCTGISGVTIPATIDSIGNSAFAGCTGLYTVYFNADSCRYMGEADSLVFGGIRWLHTLHIGNNVKAIPNYAFEHLYGLQAIVIPDSVVIVGDWAFAYDANVTELTLGNSLSHIGVGAFYGCGRLQHVTVPPSTPTSGGSASSSLTWVGGGAFGGCSFGSFTYGGTIINAGLFSGNTNLDAVFISDTITAIGDSAFNGCSGLTTVEGEGYTGIPEAWIPRTVRNVGNVAFGNCVALTRVRYDADSCIRMGCDTLPVFLNDSNISTLMIGEHVRWIPDYAFLGCSGLESITAYSMEAPVLGVDVFRDVVDTIPIYIPCGSLASYTARWSHFTNFVEGQMEDTLIVQSADAAMGSVAVLTQPTCSNARAAEIEAFANYGYHFTMWSDGVTDNPRDLIVTSDTLLTALFDRNQYMVTAQFDTLSGTVAGTGTYLYVDTARLTAIANYGYHFTMWSDGVTDNPRDFIVTSDTLLTALFDRNQYAVSVQCNSEYGTVSGSGTYLFGDMATISATANEGFRFVGWSDGVDDNPRTIRVTQDTSLSAAFDTIFFSLTLNSNNPDWGTVEGSGTYVYGTEVTITAIAHEGYDFVSWSDGNADNPRTITLLDDITLTAQFAERTAIAPVAEMQVKVYPNPTTGIVNVDAQEVQKIELFDLGGRMLRSMGQTSSVDLSTLPEGVYYLRITCKDGYRVVKVIKK